MRNTQRDVEILTLIGHYLNKQLAQQQQQQGGAGAGAATGLGGVPGGGAGGGNFDLSALRDNPQIAQLRELVAQNPALIQPLIQQLAASNPQLAQLIAQNPEALLQLLGGEGGFDYDDEGGEGGLPPGAQVINITEEERQAIERVSALLLFLSCANGQIFILRRFLARGPGFPSAGRHRGLLCLRQERGVGC